MRETYLNPTLAVLFLGFSLASIGVGYGLWSKTLVLEGTVETGRVDAKWLTAFCQEFHTWPDLPESIEGYGEAEGKLVGETTFNVDEVDDQVLHITLSNVYPSYAVDCSVKFRVEGTIPVYGRGTSIEEVSDNLHNCELEGDFTKILTCDELTVIFTDNIGSQIHPGVMGIGDLLIHVEQPAEQNTIYEFDVSICLAQWNEVANSAECFEAAAD